MFLPSWDPCVYPEILVFSPGFPLLQPGTGGSKRPLPLPGPAEAAGAHYSIRKEFGAAF